MRYVSIGIKTTGNNPETCQVVEVGAIIDDLQAINFNHTRTFRFRFDRNIYSGEPHVLVQLKDFFETIHSAFNDLDNDSYIGGEDFFTEYFERWLYRYDLDPQSFTVTGLNFVNYVDPFLENLKGVGIDIQWDKQILDPGTLFAKSNDSFIPDISQCMMRANLHIKDIPYNPDNALFDAYIACALVRSALCKT